MKPGGIITGVKTAAAATMRQNVSIRIREPHYPGIPPVE